MKTLRMVIKGIMYFFCLLFILNSCASQDDQQKQANNDKVDTIIIQQMKFLPSELVAKKGNTVVWINKDLVDHNVTEQENRSFYSDTLAVGKSWSWIVSDNVEYFCSLHPSMKGKITMVP